MYKGWVFCGSRNADNAISLVLSSSYQSYDLKPARHTLMATMVRRYSRCNRWRSLRNRKEDVAQWGGDRNWEKSLMFALSRPPFSLDWTAHGTGRDRKPIRASRWLCRRGVLRIASQANMASLKETQRALMLGGSGRARKYLKTTLEDKGNEGAHHVVEKSEQH